MTYDELFTFEHLYPDNGNTFSGKSATTGSDGTAALFFDNGEQTATLTATGYRAHTESFDIKDGGKTLLVFLEKNTHQEATGVTVSPTAVTLDVGESQQLTATVIPADAAVKTVMYASSDENVAVVSSTGLVNAIAAGSATITVATVNGKTATCMVTVNQTGDPGDLSGYSVGDTFAFGWYPQSKVTDSTTIASLNAQPQTWTSYGYYSGTGGYWDGQMTAKDYMQFCDVTYRGQKYRGVRFTQYRPYYTGYTSSASNTYQDDNGYYTNTTYWFRYEPLEWRVLDPATGLVLCETIIDSQPFNNYVLSSGTDAYGYTAWWGDAGKTHYANNYAESSLRQWLNRDFYNTAFSAAQQAIIANTTLDNSAYSTSYSAYDSAATTDKVFLLSYSDVQNASYGFAASTGSSATRQAQGSDYAKCQGLYVYSSNKCSYWRLRSAGNISSNACYVSHVGWVYNNYVSSTRHGIRPALRLNLGSGISKSKIRSAVQGAAENAEISVAVGTGMAQFSAVDGNLYMLYSVPQGTETVDPDTMQYVAQASCTGGVASAPFYETIDTVTYIVGDFGNGVEARTAVNFTPIVQYTVTWSVDGRQTRETYNVGERIVRPAAPVKAGYTFTGWSPEVPAVMPANDLTFTAQFTKNETPPAGKVRSVTADSMTLLYKDSGTIRPTVTADAGVTYTLAYSGFDSKIVSIDANGKVTTLKKGSTTVTVTATDEHGNTAETTCTVTVKYAFWQILIRIFLFGFLWY